MKLLISLDNNKLKKIIDFALKEPKNPNNFQLDIEMISLYSEKTLQNQEMSNFYKISSMTWIGYLNRKRTFDTQTTGVSSKSISESDFFLELRSMVVASCGTELASVQFSAENGLLEALVHLDVYR